MVSHRAINDIIQTPKKEVRFFFFSVCCVVLNCSWQLIMFNEKQKSYVKRIHLVTDDRLYDRKAFYTVKIVFYSSSMNDGEFINYYFWVRFPQILSLDSSHYTPTSWSQTFNKLSRPSTKEVNLEPFFHISIHHRSFLQETSQLYYISWAVLTLTQSY